MVSRSNFEYCFITSHIYTSSWQVERFHRLLLFKLYLSKYTHIQTFLSLQCTFVPTCIYPIYINQHDVILKIDKNKSCSNRKFDNQYYYFLTQTSPLIWIVLDDFKSLKHQNELCLLLFVSQQVNAPNLLQKYCELLKCSFALEDSSETKVASQRHFHCSVYVGNCWDLSETHSLRVTNHLRRFQWNYSEITWDEFRFGDTSTELWSFIFIWVNLWLLWNSCDNMILKIQQYNPFDSITLESGGMGNTAW